MANLTESGDDSSLPLSSADRTAIMEAICSWVLRLILPLLLAAAAPLFYWVWIDGERTMITLRVAGMIPLAVSFAAIAIWAVKEWLPPPRP